MQAIYLPEKTIARKMGCEELAKSYVQACRAKHSEATPCVRFDSDYQVDAYRRVRREEMEKISRVTEQQVVSSNTTQETIGRE